MEQTAETMSRIDWDLDRLQLQVDQLDTIDADIHSGIFEVSLSQAYKHLGFVDNLLKELSDDNALWLQKHEDDLDGKSVHCSSRFRAIIVEMCPSLPARVRADTMYQAIRELINRSSRPGLGSVCIMDLPNEILKRISNYAVDACKFQDYNRRDIYVRHIKSLRLTCWRFHDASSCFLVEVLSVDMTSKSLSRLSLFSRHTTISKGIRKIRIFLDYYDSVLAQDIQAFARYHARHFSLFAQQTDNQAYESNKWGVPAETMVETVKISAGCVKEWTAFSNGAGYQATTSMTILHEAHKLYQSNFQTQEKIRDGEFILAVAAAFGRLKMVGTLEIRDYRSVSASDLDQMYERKGRPPLWEIVHDHEAMKESMVFPMKWEHTRKEALGHPPIDLLVKLPVVIHQSGSRLTDIDIDVSGSRDLALFATQKHHLEELTGSVQLLKRFSFTLRDDQDESSIEVWPPRRADEILHLKSFLTHILDTSSLNHLVMDFYFLWNYEDLNLTPNLLSIIDLSAMRKWENMAYLDFDFPPLRLRDIEVLIKYVIRPRVRIYFREVLLIGANGAYHEVLDLLRTQTGPQTSFHDLHSSENGIYWANFYNAPLEGSEIQEAIEQVRLWRDVSCTKIEAYLRGLIDENPLKGYTF